MVDIGVPGSEHVLRQLTGLVLELETVATVATRVADLAVASVAGADGAGVSVAPVGPSPASAAATDGVREIDEVQYRSGRGPAAEVVANGQAVNVALPGAGSRWPELAGAAMAAGFAWVLALPMRAGDRTVGALVLYSRAVDGFDGADVAVAEDLAAQAAATLANAVALHAAQAMRRNLEIALVTRELIGQAQGLLMARHGWSGQEAFEMMRLASQMSNRKVRDIAADLVADHEGAAAGAPAAGGGEG